MQLLISYYYICFFRYSKNKIFKIVKDDFIILECLKNHVTSSDILEHTLEDQTKLFGCMTILSSISPVSLNYVKFYGFIF